MAHILPAKGDCPLPLVGTVTSFVCVARRESQQHITSTVVCGRHAGAVAPPAHIDVLLLGPRQPAAAAQARHPQCGRANCCGCEQCLARLCRSVQLCACHQHVPYPKSQVFRGISAVKKSHAWFMGPCDLGFAFTCNGSYNALAVLVSHVMCNEAC